MHLFEYKVGEEDTERQAESTPVQNTAAHLSEHLDLTQGNESGIQ